MPKRRCFLAVAFLASALSLASIAQAQVPADAPPSSSPGAAVRSIDDLQSALPYIPWDSVTHGPLIAIASEKVQWQSSRASNRAGRQGRSGNVGTVEPNDEAVTQPLYPPTDRYGLSVERVAQHFSQKLVRLSTLAVFAPPMMSLLDTDLKPANPYWGASSFDLMRRLEATLTPAQWQQLGSASGIGTGDLSKDQQDIFDAILPLTMTVQQSTVQQNASRRTRPVYDAESRQTLTPEQRQAVRLRLDRKASIDLLTEDGYSSNNSVNTEPVGTKKLTLNASQQIVDPAIVFGQRVRLEAANHLKPSDLDLKQSSLREAYVPLTDVKTVADLLKAVGAKTGLELYADGRLGGLSVSLSSDKQSVRAADVLEALCWSLTATYRKVGPIPEGNPKDCAYVLTYDRVGLATMHDRIIDWARQGVAALQMNNLTLDKAIQQQKPFQYLKFADNDSMKPTPQSEQALRDFQVKQAESGVYAEPESIPVSSLSPSQQQQVSDAVGRIEKQHQNNSNLKTVRGDRVGLREAVSLTYVLPGMGEVDDNMMWPDGYLRSGDAGQAAIEAARAKGWAKQQASQLTEAAHQKIAVSRIIVSVAPASAGELRPLLGAAHGLGIEEVWVSTPNTAAGRALLAQCVAAGSAADIRVGARVALLDAPTGSSLTPSEVDRNLLGETCLTWATRVKRGLGGTETHYIYGAPMLEKPHDTLAPESPATRTQLTDRVREIAKIPGLYSVALADAASPGREWTPEANGNLYSSYFWINSQFGYPVAVGSHFGYTVANRLAFLRQKGYDPIDIVDDGNLYLQGAESLPNAMLVPRFDVDSDRIDVLRSPMLSDAKNLTTAWQAYLAESECDMLRALHTDLLKNHPQQPVYLSSYVGHENDWNTSSYARWRDGESVPFSTSTPSADPFADDVVSQAVPGAASSEVLCAFPLGTASTEAFAPDAAKPAPSAAEADAAYYIYQRLKATANSPNAMPPGLVFDLTGLKPEDALTLLQGALGRLNIAVVHAKP